MSGNVFEWCKDDWHSNFKDAPSNGKPWMDKPVRAVYRVIRGGRYFFSAGGCRPARRGNGSPDRRYDYIGFRLVLAPVQ